MYIADHDKISTPLGFAVWAVGYLANLELLQIAGLTLGAGSLLINIWKTRSSNRLKAEDHRLKILELDLRSKELAAKERQ